MNQKYNVILLHGRWPEKIDGKLIVDIPLCNPNNGGNWMGWTKEHLETNGYSVVCPIIPDAWKAPYEEWKAQLDALDINENTILVGLSAGGYALLRWVGESGKRVKKVILVAPASQQYEVGLVREKLPFEDEFYTYEISPSLAAQIQEPVVIIVSNDDEVVGRSFEGYIPVLGARVIELEGRGHFSFLMPQLPELLEEMQR